MHDNQKGPQTHVLGLDRNKPVWGFVIRLWLTHDGDVENADLKTVFAARY